ncbi:DsbC family protein [Acinetobacter sp. ANC 3813]|uniref:DsbC family protein n=1 Tax=Acinetobacter sp. ANC 3813 TaxID=1977873 RepID=UPI000A353019|nr:DsbC family protein [Acinetobacter sp. ANC 3813]OTG90521.1 disulfide bond formation protein DsbC [Acinetobacter sp. ANC 3813]
MKKLTILAPILSSLLFSSSLSFAEDLEKINQVAQKFPRELKPEFIDKTPIEGVYALSNSRGTYLMDDKGKYLIKGKIFNINNQLNITNDIYQKHYAINPKQLPLNQAFKEVKGNGKHVIYVFADPDCPACQATQVLFEEMDNMTIYTFPFALTHLHPTAITTAKKIWCSKDPLKAWKDYLIDDKKPKQQSTDCSNPIDQNMDLTKKLNISITPTIFNSLGQRMAGLETEEEFEEFIAPRKVQLN